MTTPHITPVVVTDDDRQLARDIITTIEVRPIWAKPPTEEAIAQDIARHCAMTREVIEAAAQLRAHVATLPEETQRLLNLTGWMTELRDALTRVGKP